MHNYKRGRILTLILFINEYRPWIGGSYRIELIISPITSHYSNQTINFSGVEYCNNREMVTRRIREDGDERGLLIYGYEFRPVFKPI